MRARLHVISLLLVASQALAAEVLIEGDRLTIHARDDDLRDVLKSFVHAGVNVKIDPAVDKQVSGTFVDEDMQSALGTLLDPYGYAVIWEVVPGPLGDIPRLAELQVFRQDEKEKLEPLIDANGILRVTRGPSGGAEFVQDEILVSVRYGATLQEFRLLLSQIGGTVVGSIPELGIYQLRLLPGANIPALIEQLLKNPLIQNAEPNYVSRIPAPAASPSSSPSKAPELDDISFPEGAARIAVMDSGLLPESGLGSSVVGQFDAVVPDRALGDADGHGTQMAMIASGAIAPSGAPSPGAVEGVPIIAVRAFDDEGKTSNYTLMRSINYAVSKGARVANLSWGTETRSGFIEEAMNYAQNKGMVIVAAAGNEPTGRPQYPAAYNGVLAVSALNADGTRWQNSNFGPNISLAAPGQAQFPVGHNGPPGPYAGTSISSAYVSRQLALYFTKNPEATRQVAIKALLSAVNQTGAKKADPYLGYGKLDAVAAARFLK